MKKVLALVTVIAFAAGVSADITDFTWTGDGQSALNQSGTSFASGGATVFSLIDQDLSASISGGEIDISVLTSATLAAGAGAAAPINVYANLFSSGWNIGTTTIRSDNTNLGTAYAIIVDQGGYTALADIQQGDYVAFLTGGTVTDRQPGTDPELTTQEFAVGSFQTNVQVVPEPATIGLFGLGALSAWMIRRNKQKATEEEA